MKAKRLRNSELYSRVFIAKDQSKEQRKKEKNLRLELKELRETVVAGHLKVMIVLRFIYRRL